MFTNPYSHGQERDDEAPDPCQVCGGNFENVDCATRCEGCEGCPVSGQPCHSCTCPPEVPNPSHYEERCSYCGGWLKQCQANPAACIAEAERMSRAQFGN